MPKLIWFKYSLSEFVLEDMKNIHWLWVLKSPFSQSADMNQKGLQVWELYRYNMW